MAKKVNSPKEGEENFSYHGMFKIFEKTDAAGSA